MGDAGSRCKGGVVRAVGEIVEVGGLDDSALCAIVASDGRAAIAVNARYPMRARLHAAAHLQYPGDFVQLCSVDCRGEHAPPPG